MVKNYYRDGQMYEVEDDDKSILIGTKTVDLTSPTITSENIASNNRNIRNQLLQETDWTANSDVTMSSDMKTYRKALRDLPTHKNWPNLESSDWPTKPS
tara:strand:- start:604 stop:900 length:297 start_codon:yes stop_codon:yes gene_type:complete